MLKNVNFYGGTGTLTPQSKPILNELVQILKDNPALKIEVQGHVCCQRREPKSDDYTISELRAKMVYNYLIKNGIDKARLSSRGFEGRKPLYKIPEKNEAERQANRRVEIKILEN